MKIEEFDFTLPEHLIAQEPVVPRSGSRLLRLGVQQERVQEAYFYQLGEWLGPGDVLVFNNTRVIPARLKGHKESGGKLEILVERLLPQQQAWVQVKSNRPLKPGLTVTLAAGIQAQVLGREGPFYLVEFHTQEPLLEWLQRHGEVPLPPYIRRQPNQQDQADYQTIYATNAGAVAAPTAGLHFDEALMQQLRSKGVECVFVTLHVGAGTFKPIQVADIRQHQMHRERWEVSTAAISSLHQARRQGKRIIAVGTTSLRCIESLDLESLTTADQTADYQGETDIYIYPGYQFKLVDALITNFHLPKTSLFVLVCAFAGTAFMQRMYQYAIERQYRFFSYGDAMLIERVD